MDGYGKHDIAGTDADPSWKTIMYHQPFTKDMPVQAGSQKERYHQRTTYLIKGNTVCIKTFKFLHAVSQNRLTALLKWYREHGLVPKEKRSGGRNSDRPFSFHDIQRTMSFITIYAEDHALDLPGRVPGFKREDVKLMPSSETKIKLFEAYCSAMTQSGFRVMSQC